jgi:PAS domain S-box-containing protein
LKIEKPNWLEQMEGILETLNEGVMIMDDCQRVLFVNECFERLSGMPRAEIAGKTPERFYQGEDLEKLNAQIVLGQARGYNRYEHFIPRAGGAVRVPVVISARELEDPEGRVFSVVTFTDITEQKQAQEELRGANLKLKKRQEEIEVELSLAARVQHSLTPQAIRWGAVTVETYYMPARTIGGDFGIVTPLEDGNLHLLVCDVSGHGIGSALLANRIYTETMSLLERGSQPRDLLRSLNSFVLQHIRTSGFYFTLASARLDQSGRRLSFAGGGHPPAFLITPGGECRQLESLSSVLGALEDVVPSEPTVEAELAAGDRLVLYTDGLTEVFDAQEEMLGVDGLAEIVRTSAELPLDEMKHSIVERVNAYREGPATDDMSLVVVEVD